MQQWAADSGGSDGGSDGDAGTPIDHGFAAPEPPNDAAAWSSTGDLWFLPPPVPPPPSSSPQPPPLQTPTLSLPRPLSTPPSTPSAPRDHPRLAHLRPLPRGATLGSTLGSGALGSGRVVRWGVLERRKESAFFGAAWVPCLAVATARRTLLLFDLQPTKDATKDTTKDATDAAASREGASSLQGTTAAAAALRLRFARSADEAFADAVCRLGFPPGPSEAALFPQMRAPPQPQSTPAPAPLSARLASALAPTPPAEDGDGESAAVAMTAIAASATSGDAATPVDGLRGSAAMAAASVASDDDAAPAGTQHPGPEDPEADPEAAAAAEAADAAVGAALARLVSGSGGSPFSSSSSSSSSSQRLAGVPGPTLSLRLDRCESLWLPALALANAKHPPPPTPQPPSSTAAPTSAEASSAASALQDGPAKKTGSSGSSSSGGGSMGPLFSLSPHARPQQIAPPKKKKKAKAAAHLAVADGTEAAFVLEESTPVATAPGGDSTRPRFGLRSKSSSSGGSGGAARGLAKVEVGRRSVTLRAPSQEDMVEWCVLAKTAAGAVG